MQKSLVIGYLNIQYKKLLIKCFLVGIITISLSNNVMAAAVNNGTVPTMDANTLGDNTLLNNGTITPGSIFNPTGVNITAGMYGYNAAGASYVFTNSNGAVININGTGQTYGLYANANGSHSLTNSGSLSVDTAGTAYGMYANGIGNHTLINNDTVTITGAGIFGIEAQGTGSHTLANHGTITATAGSGGFNYAMVVFGNGNHRISNSGTINASITNGTVIGAYSAGNGNHTFINDGSVTATSITGTAYGVLADGNGSHSLTNNGRITATTRGAGSGAYGMRAEGTGDHSLINRGTITTEATAWDAYGLYAEGIGNHTLTNHNKITATGEYVRGMVIENATGAIVNNFGTILATSTIAGGDAVEVLGVDSNYTVGTWATTLRTWTSADTVFAVTGGGTIGFNSGTTLIVRPDTAARGFVLEQEYDVADMIRGNYAGEIGTVTTEVPFLKATLSGKTIAVGQTVRLDPNVNSNTTPGTTTMQQAVANVQSQFNGLSNALRNSLVRIYTEANLVADAEQNNTSGVAAGSSFTPKSKWQVFLNPYVNSVNNSDLEYNGSSVGISGGATYKVNEQFSFGGHLDFNSANYYADIMDMSTKSTSFALGLHAAFNFTPEWYLRGQLTGSVNQNDSNYETGTLITLNADSTYNGEAIYAALSTGYIWQFGQGHSITPEVGLSYLGTHTNAYDIEWSGGIGGLGGLYGLSYDDSYYNAFYANFNLDWRSEWELGNSRSLALLVGAGLRQKLSANDMETSLRMLGSKYTTQYTEDPTTFLVNAGVEYSIDNFSVSLNYDGGFGTYQTMHGGNVIVKIEF